MLPYGPEAGNIFRIEGLANPTFSSRETEKLLGPGGYLAAHRSCSCSVLDAGSRIDTVN